jgi:hypothetical protein
MDAVSLILDKLYALIGDPRLSGCTPYVAARKIGATDAVAERIAELWRGPDRFP